MKKVLMIVGDFVEDYEMMVARQMLQLMGCEVARVCPEKKKGECVKTAVHEKMPGCQTYVEREGHHCMIDEDITKLKLDEWDALYIPGGRAPEYLRNCEECVHVVKHFMENKKPISATCHGIQLLVQAGDLKGRKLTGFKGCEMEAKLAGADFKNVKSEDFVCDGNLVTFVNYDGLPNAMRCFGELLGITLMNKK